MAEITASDHVAVNWPGTIESSTSDRSSERRCIYKVPDHLRKSNEKSYTPQVIAIGPLHRGNKKLQAMENHKLRYLTDFMQRADTNFEDLESFVRDKEQLVRDCYAEKIELNSVECVKMILHDAIFIIEYFLRVLSPVQWRGEDRIMGEVKWTDENRMKPWQTARLPLDFLLLENQLPFFIIEEIYQLHFSDRYPAFIAVAFNYFDLFNTQSKSMAEFPRILHFVDLLRSFYLPPRESFRFSVYRYSDTIEEMYSASQLAEAGLIFKKSASRYQLDIKFQDGVLEIPGFTLDKSTELYARNLMALEELHHYQTPAYITDYFRFLDFLIDTDKDVGLLRRKKILVNRLGNNCATIVNNLCPNDVDADTRMVYYYHLCRELVRFYNNPWNSWKVKLRRDLSTPWVIVTTASAIFLLVLTLVQTVCTVISTVK